MSSELRECLKPSIDELKSMFDYNPETGALIWTKRLSNSTPVGKQVGSKDTKGRLRVQIRERTYAVHHICFAMYHGRWPLEQIDHINRVKTDNRIVNLREATNAQNARNRKHTKPNNSGYKGVCLHHGRYMARIMINGVKKHLGMFSDPVEAAKAYDEAALLYHGEFASTNELWNQRGGPVNE